MTEKVINKAETSKKSKENRPQGKVTTYPVIDACCQRHPIQHALSYSFESQGSYFFIRNHVALGPGGQSNWFLGQLVLQREARVQGVLAEAITSVGMATLSNINRSTGQMAAARLKYSAALRATNCALLDPLEARSDETFIAIMLLAAFEVSPGNLAGRTHTNFYLDHS